MTIPFGRYRWTMTLTRTTAPRQRREATILVGMTDRELARLSRRGTFDLDQARWDALAVTYGGVRRP